MDITYHRHFLRAFASVATIALATAIHPVARAETIQFDANRESNELKLVDDVPVMRQTSDGGSVLAPIENSDYFERDGIRLRVPQSFPRGGNDAYLIIEHLDWNIAQVAVRYDRDSDPAKPNVYRPAAYANATALAGYTATGTGQLRHAVFRLVAPTFQHRQRNGGDIQIEGVKSLLRVTLTTDRPADAIEQARREIPQLPNPQFTLKNPMQLVVSLSTDATAIPNIPGLPAQMDELCPMMRALGFNAVEVYVKWSAIEREKGKWDWSFYDQFAANAAKHGLKWFPLVVTGSAYTIPAWYHDSPENIGFKCLEHNKSNNIQTIFTEVHTPYAQTFLKKFGEHYGDTDALLGIRLGPSGNYGESQYPAGGNLGFAGEKEHIHIGWWAGDDFAAAHFQDFLKAKYPTIEALNVAWKPPFGSLQSFASFSDVKPFIPQFAESRRQRKDFVDWYLGAMTDWCERWAVWAREAMPDKPIYQSSGGWGFVESGTDFTDQTASMAKIKGGIRSTNEVDSYVQTFYATRMPTSAARFYDVPFGAEPAGFGSARGVMGRLFNILVNNGQHLFYYHGNLVNNDQAIDRWLKYAPLLDRRAEPLIEIAALYPDTMSKLDDSVFRNLYAFTFNTRIAAFRPLFDFDFCSERMILDGALPRYKALIVPWNFVVEANALNAIDQWVRGGGTLICSDWRGAPVMTVEGDTNVWDAWMTGDFGNGNVVFVPDDREPPQRLARGVANALKSMPNLDRRTHAMLNTEHSDEVYVSVLATGAFAVLNFSDNPITVSIPGVEKPLEIEPYGIAMTPDAALQ
ncbi:MAG: beta-galactosidase [Candidatus Hydrogenedentes bacterium]|nr:beta-galactosidase [Candidatus Hydrogenedentota bacterium]